MQNVNIYNKPFIFYKTKYKSSPPGPGRTSRPLTWQLKRPDITCPRVRHARGRAFPSRPFMRRRGPGPSAAGPPASLRCACALACDRARARRAIRIRRTAKHRLDSLPIRVRDEPGSLRVRASTRTRRQIRVVGLCRSSAAHNDAGTGYLARACGRADARAARVCACVRACACACACVSDICTRKTLSPSEPCSTSAS